jgi:hypothetical protein
MLKSRKSIIVSKVAWGALNPVPATLQYQPFSALIYTVDDREEGRGGHTQES